MHSLRCLRMVQMKTFVVIGFVTLSITFLLLLYYSSSSHPEVSHSQFVYKFANKQQQHPKNGKKNGTLDFSSEGDTLYFDAKDTRPPLSSARLAKYCNHAHNHMEGQEGLAPSNYKLLAVHTVIRHGDRSPIQKLPQGLSGDLSCLLDTEGHSHVSKIVNMPHVLTAEMAKTPSYEKSFSRWSMFPSHELCGEGQLTGQGAIQHVLNGMHFSERYIHRHGLFTDSNWHQRILIHSTEISRTYQSAIAFAYGMLPHFNIEKINIKPSFGVNFCEDREFGLACQCQKMEEFRLKAESECKVTPQIKKNFQNYKALLSYVTSVLNVSPFSIAGPTSLMDGCSSFMCHNKPYPCNTTGTCINTSIMEALWKIIDTKSDCLGKSKSYKTHARALMHGLLSRIVRNFNVSSYNGTNASFHLYSGHDTTVTPLIAALDLSDNVWPGYAHMITFELWRDSNSKNNGDNTYVRVLQNGRLVTDQVVFCKQKTLEHGMCHFKHFLSHVKARNLKSFCFSKTSTEFM